MNLTEIKMKYEVARLKAKLAVDSMGKSGIKVIRNELRDLNDFIKEV